MHGERWQVHHIGVDMDVAVLVCHDILKDNTKEDNLLFRALEHSRRFDYSFVLTSHYDTSQAIVRKFELR